MNLNAFFFFFFNPLFIRLYHFATIVNDSSANEVPINVTYYLNESRFKYFYFIRIYPFL